MSQPTKARHGATANHHKEAGNTLPHPAQKSKEEKQNEFLIYEKFREETV